MRRFELLGMTNTAERNGVLIYIAPRARQFRILGDTAIHEKCGDDFWKEVAAAMEEHFRKGEFTEGVVAGIERVGEVLARHFPRRPDDRNELPNTDRRGVRGELPIAMPRLDFQPSLTIQSQSSIVYLALTLPQNPYDSRALMYAIVRAGGKQLKVAAGDVVRIEKPAGRSRQGARRSRFRPSVILVRGTTGVRTGAEALKGVKVQATVLGEVRTRKVLVFKKKRTKQYRRTKGHRQTMVQVRIEAIEG